MAKKKILIIDDEIELCQLLQDLFKDARYDAFFATDSVEGLAIARERSPMVIILDYAMPIIDGIEVLTEVKKFMSEVVVIMLTGRGSEEVAVEVMKRGAADYICKPFSAKKLLERVDANIRSHFSRLIWRNGKYSYPIEIDEILRRYEFVRGIYATPGADINKMSRLFGFSRHDFYVFDRRMKKFGVYGLFGKSHVGLQKELGAKVRLEHKKALQPWQQPAGGKITKVQRYTLKNFINPNDRIQVKLEMMRAAATNGKPHIGQICKKFGFTRELFYLTYRRFEKYGVLGLIPKLKGRMLKKWKK